VFLWISDGLKLLLLLLVDGVLNARNSFLERNTLMAGI